MPDEFRQDVDMLRISDPKKAAMCALRDAKIHALRVKRESDLDALLPPIRPGHSYHVLSAGDVDAMSYLGVLVTRHGPFPMLYMSTWSMSRDYTNALEEHLDSRAVGTFCMFTGDYFAQREPANYTRIVQLAELYQGRIYRFSNHCKMFAMHNPDANFYAVVESSANCTRNPRTEQTVITHSRELYRFYRQWFEDVAHERN